MMFIPSTVAIAAATLAAIATLILIALKLYKPAIVVVLILLFSTYQLGYSMSNDSWKSKVHEMELTISKLETRNAKIGTEIVTKIITKQQKVIEKGEDVIRYIDREVVKYDNTCTIPQEVLDAHNNAITP